MLRVKSVFGAMLVAGALGLAVLPASAQQRYKGSFNLPVETNVGGVVLEPGDYTITVDRLGVGGVDMIHVQGAGGTASVLAGSTEIRSASDRGRLVLVSAGGMHALREFDAGLIERSYTF